MKGSLACCSAVASSIKVEHSWPAVPRPALPVCLGSPALAAGTAHEGTEKLLFCRDAVGFPTPRIGWLKGTPELSCRGPV